MLVEVDPDQLGALVDLVAVHAGREGRLLQLLAHGLWLQGVDAVRAHEAAGVNEARQLVAGEQRPFERGVPWHREVLGVGEHGLDDFLGPAFLAEDRRAVLGVLVEGRVHLVVEVVEQSHRAP